MYKHETLSTISNTAIIISFLFALNSSSNFVVYGQIRIIGVGVEELDKFK